MQNTWKVLIVDDDVSIHRMTNMILDEISFEGKKISLLNAYSGSDAKAIISKNDDIAVIILDVVMQTSDEGLNLVKYIRSDLENWIVRIILRTGQPGQAPEKDVIINYDINDYKEKSELTSRKLFTTMISALRSYRDLSIIDSNRKDLCKIIESSSNITKLQSMKEFASGVLSQITNLLNLKKDALFCKLSEDNECGKYNDNIYVLASTGRFQKSKDKDIRDYLNSETFEVLLSVFKNKKSIFSDRYSMVYFESKFGSENIIYLEDSKKLLAYSKEIVCKYCISISNTFDNIYLNNKIIKTLRESILVVDEQNNIVLLNGIFNETYKDIMKVVPSTKDIISFLKTHMDDTQENEKIITALENFSSINIKGEVSIIEPENRIYSVNIHPVFKNNDEIMGRVISFSDITDYKYLLNELETKNKKLEEYAKTAEELAISKERNRFARDIHDTLGHNMTMLISQIEIALMDIDENPESAKENMQHALKYARGGLKDIRRSISGLMPKTLEVNNLIAALEGLIADCRRSGIKIDFYVEGSQDYKSPVLSDVLYRVCQESLTNSIKHGKASVSTVIVKFLPDIVKLFIFDNGIGCNDIEEGFGLTGMKQRIAAINGKLKYGSDGETGFNVSVEIPLEVKKID